MPLTQQGKEIFEKVELFFREHPERWIAGSMAGTDEEGRNCFCFAGRAYVESGLFDEERLVLISQRDDLYIDPSVARNFENLTGVPSVAHITTANDMAENPEEAIGFVKKALDNLEEVVE
jgi:hypothetical protein